MASFDQDRPHLAAKYDAVSDLQYNNGVSLVDSLGIKKGDHVLDIGCGTGRLAFYTARKVGPSGRVLGIDPAPLRIELADKKLAEERLPNVEFRVAGSDDLKDYPAGQFDALYLSAVFHWIPNQDYAAEQFLRVLRPGGRIGMHTLNRDRMPVINEGIRNLLAREPYARQVDASKDAMKLVNARDAERILRSAGFQDIRVNVVTKRKIWKTPAEGIEFVEASSFGNFLSYVPESILGAFRKDLEAELEKKRTDQGIVNVSSTLFVTARKP